MKRSRLSVFFSASGGCASTTRLTLYQEGVSSGKWGKIGLERAPVLCRQAMIKINKTFDETGCVDKTLLKSSTKRIETVTIGENLQRVKEEVRVYTHKVKDLVHLREVITREASIIASDRDLLKKVCLSVTGIMNECIDANGGHFEQQR